MENNNSASGNAIPYSDRVSPNKKIVQTVKIKYRLNCGILRRVLRSLVNNLRKVSTANGKIAAARLRSPAVKLMLKEKTTNVSMYPIRINNAIAITAAYIHMRRPFGFRLRSSILLFIMIVRKSITIV